MKIQKKLFIFAVLLMAASLVFAQTSMTSHSTQELFGTDVDDFMNVNEWQNVKPKNIFGFLGYGKNGIGSINLGLAHQFKAFYLGSYFEGQIPGWSKVKDSTTSTTTTQTDNEHLATGKLLFGFGNIGIMTDISYEPKPNNKVTWNSDTKVKQIDNLFKLDVKLAAGINLNSNNKVFKITPRLGLKSDIKKNRTITEGKLTSLTDENKFDLLIGIGFSHDFLKKDAVTHTIMADLDTEWRIFPKKTNYTDALGVTSTTYTYGELHDKIKITPKYQIAYEPEGKFAVKAEAGLETNLSFEKDMNYTKTINSLTGTTTAYKTPREHKTNFSISPNIKAAFVYAPIKKLKFNFGLDFKVPSISLKTKKTETRDASGKVTKTVRNSTFEFITADGKFSATSGLTWLITENVVLDANWNIINNLFNTFSSNLAEGSGTSILNTINKLVVHNIRFAVSVKF
ncbi:MULTISPECIES: hypothetical protein [unclassified Treponema]|uniref:TDE2508 family outer membrane beta-barrel protein n=1 Tax=unclassified Treponema TaxID=2638727 RepID=UPI0020A4EA8B|nr:MULTISPECIES: hypothetical protein [unclassified Treponema]UTC67397.1 hypothetical protein E4O06_01630 [Treponema sp. OMZ 789]UTC70125.1 hypothetical protein E4O01_01625 [Treponema sp. OMZ 790]UTC72840.1 hypothetical protein E4O02_01625 [Treponema sp. OMZ 791]